jgi:hypothetical protein
MRIAIVTFTTLTCLCAWNVAASRTDGSLTSRADTRTVECTFSNPGYAGLCTETTTAPETKLPEEACRPILECLNDARCVKTYCGATTIRDGWKLESAKARGK